MNNFSDENSGGAKPADIDAQTSQNFENSEAIEPNGAAVQGQPAKKLQGQSTGPRSTHGKNISSRNAVTNGYFSKELISVHLRKKDRKSYLKLLSRFLEQYDPIGQTELVQVELMTFHLHQYVRLMRHMSIMSGDSDLTTLVANLGAISKDKNGWLDDLPKLELLEKYQKYEAHILRNFYRSQAELERLQKVRRGEQVLPRVTVDINT